MKVLKLFFGLALLISIFSSCTKNEESFPITLPVINTIEGEWNFKESQCECNYHGIFEDGDYVWNINANGTIALDLNVAVNEGAGVPFLNDNTVNYSLGNSEITIEGTTYDFILDGDELFIYLMPESDGPNWKLAR